METSAVKSGGGSSSGAASSNANKADNTNKPDTSSSGSSGSGSSSNDGQRAQSFNNALNKAKAEQSNAGSANNAGNSGTSAANDNAGTATASAANDGVGGTDQTSSTASTAGALQATQNGATTNSATAEQGASASTVTDGANAANENAGTATASAANDGVDGTDQTSSNASTEATQNDANTDNGTVGQGNLASTDTDNSGGEGASAVDNEFIGEQPQKISSGIAIPYKNGLGTVDTSVDPKKVDERALFPGSLEQGVDLDIANTLPRAFPNGALAQGGGINDLQSDLNPDRGVEGSAFNVGDRVRSGGDDRFQITGQFKLSEDFKSVFKEGLRYAIKRADNTTGKGFGGLIQEFVIDVVLDNVTVNTGQLQNSQGLDTHTGGFVFSSKPLEVFVNEPGIEGVNRGLPEFRTPATFNSIIAHEVTHSLQNAFVALPAGDEAGDRNFKPELKKGVSFSDLPSEDQAHLVEEGFLKAEKKHAKELGLPKGTPIATFANTNEDQRPAG